MNVSDMNSACVSRKNPGRLDDLLDPRRYCGSGSRFVPIGIAAEPAAFPRIGFSELFSIYRDGKRFRPRYRGRVI